MDYQEAIELLKDEIKCSCYRNRGYCGICTIYSELDRDKIIDACKCAISAIQELQEYQKIGTLEEMKMLKATHFSGIELAKISCRLKQLEKYVDIGTLEEVRDALERQEKYRWHNLNKDPEDLPKNLSKNYLFESKWGQVFKGTFRIVGNIKLFETHIYSKVHGGDIWIQYKTCNVVRWKEIEPMEE